jgi:hypothetical protein
MTIAFHCTECNKPLRAGDEAAGKPAKCTGCGAIVRIPAVEDVRWPPGTRPPTTPAQSPFADVKVPVPLGFDESDPPLEALSFGHQAQPSGFTAPKVTPSAPAPISRRRRRAVGVDAIVARAWEIYKANFGLVVMSCIAAQLLMGLINAGVAVGLQQMGILRMDQIPSDGDLVQTAATYITPIISIWFVLGIFTLQLNLARGRDAAVGDVFSGSGLFLSGLAVWLLYFVPHFLFSLICGRLGLTPPEYVAVVAPLGILITYLLWLPAMLVLIDRTSQPLDAVVYGLSYVGQNIFTLLGLFIVSLCVFAVSLLACGVGLIFGIPFILLLLAVAYASNTPEI